MKEYSHKEIGMLVGTAVGGALAVTCFSIWNEYLLFILAGVGIITGTVAGSFVDKKLYRDEENNTKKTKR